MRPTERAPRVVETLRDEEVADWLEGRDRAALLFWDADDDLSRKLRARLEIVAAASDVDLGVLDTRREPLVAQALGVKSVPTIVVFRGGDVVERMVGAPPENVLREALR